MTVNISHHTLIMKDIGDVAAVEKKEERVEKKKDKPKHKFDQIPYLLIYIHTYIHT